ncbi:MAG: hypothetical protein U1E87_10855 [Alphaproteobacteria bacterium]
MLLVADTEGIGRDRERADLVDVGLKRVPEQAAFVEERGRYVTPGRFLTSAVTSSASAI